MGLLVLGTKTVTFFTRSLPDKFLFSCLNILLSASHVADSDFCVSGSHGHSHGGHGHSHGGHGHSHGGHGHGHGHGQEDNHDHDTGKPHDILDF